MRLTTCSEAEGHPMAAGLAAVAAGDSSEAAGELARSEGLETPNLLIRRDLRPHPLAAHTPLTCWNAAQRCAMTGGVERCCKAKMRPVEPGNHRQPGRELTVNSRLTVNARCGAVPYEIVPDDGPTCPLRGQAESHCS
jgi:hypothetical protein